MLFFTGGPFSRRTRKADLGAARLGRQGIDRVTSLALALAPWPGRRALKVEKMESVSRDSAPSPRCRAGGVKLALRQSCYVEYIK